MNDIKYIVNPPIISEEVMDLIGKFPQYCWRTKEKTAEALKSAICCVAAYNKDKLVGLVLAGSPDNAYFIYIHSLMVLPELQNHGIGTQLIKRILSHCEQLDYMDTVCFAAPGARTFLEKMGFVKDLDNIQGMILKHDIEGEK